MFEDFLNILGIGFGNFLAIQKDPEHTKKQRKMIDVYRILRVSDAAKYQGERSERAKPQRKTSGTPAKTERNYNETLAKSELKPQRYSI